MSHRRAYLSSNPVPMQSTMTAPRAYYLPEDAEISDVDLDRRYSWNQEPGVPPPPRIHTEMHENMSQSNNQNDITEIYRRKPPENYNVTPEMMMSEEHPRYYYRPAALSRIPQRRLPIPNPTGPTNLGAYYPPPLEEPRSSYAEMLYRNQPHVQQRVHESNRPMSSSTMPRHPQRLMVDSNRPMTNLVRSIRNPTSNSSTKPVSVRTPRFYRRQNIYKRPSILCLQLPSTPDPSARPMKSRLPSTMPGLSLPPHMRAPSNNPYSNLQPMGCSVPLPPSRGQSTIMHQQREMEDRDRERGVRGRVSSRSAPPVMDERNKEIEDMMRVGMMMENRNMAQEFGEDNVSLMNDQDTENKCSELELLLNQYEQIFNTTSEEAPTSKQTSRRSNAKSRLRRRASVGRFIGMLKPKIPPSLKKHSSSKHSLKHSHSTRLEIEQMTAEVLDNLLKDLNAGGLVSDSKQSNRTPRTNHSASEHKQREGEHENRERSNERPSRDFEEGENNSGGSSGDKLEEEEKPTRSKNEERKSPKKSVSYLENETKKSDPDNTETNTTFIQDQEKFNYESSTTFEKGKTSENDGSSRAQTPDPEVPTSVPGSRDKDSCNKRSLWTNNKSKPDQDGTTALELHRSKSYIVNLIDRALSRELGTIPEERPSKQYLNLDPKTAMDLMQTKQLDTDMCLEISQAIAESFGKETIGCPVCTQPATSMPSTCCSKGADRGDTVKEGELLFSTGSDEPLYIKQLKKLRWGHLKHIQREMRRLEDLERFLDSCGSDK